MVYFFVTSFPPPPSLLHQTTRSRAWSQPKQCCWCRISPSGRRILHPILHRKSSGFIGLFFVWCRKCRFFSKTFFERRGVERCLALLIWLIENVEFHSSFSRHGKAQAVLGSAHLACRKRCVMPSDTWFLWWTGCPPQKNRRQVPVWGLSPI